MGTLWIVWAAIAVLLLICALRSSHAVYRVIFGVYAFRYWVIVGLPALAVWSMLRAFGVA
jgi:hypothetical protein